MIQAKQRLLPLWFEIILICVLLLFSGLFAGLTLGLLSLDTTSLKVSQFSTTLKLLKLKVANDDVDGNVIH